MNYDRRQDQEQAEYTFWSKVQQTLQTSIKLANTGDVGYLDMSGLILRCTCRVDLGKPGVVASLSKALRSKS